MSKRIVSVAVLLTLSISAHPLNGAAAFEPVPFVAAITPEGIRIGQERQAPQTARTATNEALSDRVRQPELRSAAPCYARLALDRSGSKVLSIVFDESEGTGKGYDLLYADMNFNGVFEPAEKFKAKAREREGKPISNLFPPIRLSVPYNERVGDQAHWSVAFTYETPKDLTSAWISEQRPPPLSVRGFRLAASVSMRRDSTRWRYFLSGAITPSGTLKTASIWKIGDLKLELISGPDEEANKGSLGIGLRLKAGEKELASYRGGLLARARVEIKDPNGRVVHKVEDALDKFGFS